MANKRLIDVPLTEIRTGDAEVIGSLYPHKGKIYRWVKNAGATDLTATAPCLTLPTSAIDAIGSRVVAPSGAGPSTAVSASILNIAGATMAAITKSGSDTGDHGWIQVKGVKKVSMGQSATAADQLVGAISVVTNTDDAAWGVPVVPVDSGGLAPMHIKSVRLVRLHATTGATTAFSAYADIQCL